MSRTRDQVIATFRDVIQQPGSESIQIAQDLLEEGDVTLAEAGEIPRRRPIAKPSDWPLEHVQRGAFRLASETGVFWTVMQAGPGYKRPFSVTWEALYIGYTLYPSPVRRRDRVAGSPGVNVLSELSHFETLEEAVHRGAQFAWNLVKAIKASDALASVDEIDKAISSLEGYMDPFGPPTPRELISRDYGRDAKPNPHEGGRMPSSKALRMYEGFHQHEPKKIATFNGGRGLAIPSKAILIGDAVHVLYKSDKLNPTTGIDEGWIDYIHEHKKGVKVYRCDGRARGIERSVPSWIVNSDDLVWLGQCNGFAYQDDEGVHEAKGTRPYPDLFCTPNGKALLVIQGKRTLLAIIWGGRLGVEPRGIVN